MILPALYPIVDVASDGAGELREKRALALELARCGARVLQLRAQPLPASTFLDFAKDVQSALHAAHCRIIVNDRVDVALAARADGVHVGDEDLPVAAARRLLGDGKIVGFSTHSPAEAASAQGSGADYLGFGPVYESPTKPGVRSARGLEQLAETCRNSKLPVVAIGGVSAATAADVFRAGAASCAVISELGRTDDLAGLFAAYASAQN